jgi:hypothetical protein
MKKLMTILAIASTTILFTSCSKEDDGIITNYKKAAFGGMISSNGSLTINGNPAVLNQVYDVKKGDVLKFIDNGNDIYHQGFTWYSTTGSPNIVNPGTIEQGLTYGEIIIETGSVANSYGQDDVNLTYIVK